MQLLLMTGFAASQLFLAGIFFGNIFMALLTTLVACTFKCVQFVPADFLACKDIPVVAGFALFNLHTLFIGYLLTILHAVMAFTTLKCLLVLFVGKNRRRHFGAV